MPAIPVVVSITLASALSAQQFDASLPRSGERAPVDPVVVSRHAGLSEGPRGVVVGMGPDYRATIDTGGLRFEPALGRSAPTTQHLALTSVALLRGGEPLRVGSRSATPSRQDNRVVFDHGTGVSERFEVGVGGVEVSWCFGQPLPGTGDLVVRYVIDSSLAAPSSGAELQFASPWGGVRIGDVHGYDAAGRRTPGSARWVDGAVELSLPGSFVDTATFPLVLDPLIGAWLPASAGDADTDPDAAYDAANDNYLVVWLRAFSATSTKVCSQLVSASGQLVGTPRELSALGAASAPQAANYGALGVFGVVWTETLTSASQVRFNRVNAATGAPATTAGYLLLNGLVGDYGSADIGCETAAPLGSGRAFVACWRDDALGRISAKRISYSVQAMQTVSPTFPVLVDDPNVTYTEPAIARTAAADGNLLLVARENGPAGREVVGRIVRTDSSSAGVIGTVYEPGPYDVIDHPDVDGFGGKWVVGWQNNVLGLSGAFAQTAGVVLDGAGALQSTFGFGSPGSIPTSSATRPAVGFTPGRVWFAWIRPAIAFFPPGSEILGVDAGSAKPVGTSGVEHSVLSATSHAIATATSGGSTSTEHALWVYSQSASSGQMQIIAQRLINHGPGGGIADLGGSCGQGGTQAFSHTPAIGSSGLVCSVAGLPPSALLTVFNFSASTTTNSCGPCIASPLTIVQTPPLAGGSSSIEFAIPYVGSLVGATFETQWTTLDFTQTPCPVFPGLCLSERRSLTIGN